MKRYNSVYERESIPKSMRWPAKVCLALAERHRWLHVAVDAAKASIAKAEGAKP